MDEATWLASTDPQAMLAYLTVPLALPQTGLRYRPPCTARRLRLFACACLAKRHGDEWPFLQEAYEAAEVGAFDLTEPVELSPIEQALSWCQLGVAALAGDPQAALLREIFGNPFRQVTLCGTCVACRRFDAPCADCGLIRVKSDGAVLRLAQAIYDGRDWSAMPILGDALEEAGCTDASILEHCRKTCEACTDKSGFVWGRVADCRTCGGIGNALHVRGCWVVDLILGKS